MRPASLGFGLAIYLLSAFILSSAARAQEDFECPETTEYSEAHSLTLHDVPNCPEVVAKIERGARYLLRSQCDVRDAGIEARREDGYGRANDLIEESINQLNEASRLFAEVLTATEIPLPIGESGEISDEINEALETLAFFGHTEPPQTYSDAFEILSTEAEIASGALADIQFTGEENVRVVKDTMDDSMIRATAVFRAIRILLDQPVEG